MMPIRISQSDATSWRERGCHRYVNCLFFFFQAEDGIRDVAVTGVQTCALPILGSGAIPAIRIGTQPYGVLPATTISRMDWLTAQDDNTPGAHLPSTPFNRYRSEERRVGKECRSRWSPYH